MPTTHRHMISAVCPGGTDALYKYGRQSYYVSDVTSWLRSNRLQLNAAKTEELWCWTVRRQHHIPIAPITVVMTPVRAVRDLSVYMDSGLTMQVHVAKTVSNCFAEYSDKFAELSIGDELVLQSLVVYTTRDWITAVSFDNLA